MPTEAGSARCLGGYAFSRWPSSFNIHPDGWLSGVYYVSVPENAHENGRSGCLVLGCLEIKGLDVPPPWGIRDIRPIPGRLVLFPSYIPHATVATNLDDVRISVAFDVILSPT